MLLNRQLGHFYICMFISRDIHSENTFKLLNLNFVYFSGCRMGKVLFLCPVDPIDKDPEEIFNVHQELLARTRCQPGCQSHVTVPYYRDRIPQAVTQNLEKLNAVPEGADETFKRGSPNISSICRKDWRDRYRHLETLSNIGCVVAYSSSRISSYNTGIALREKHGCKLFVIIVNKSERDQFITAQEDVVYIHLDGTSKPDSLQQIQLYAPGTLTSFHFFSAAIYD